VLSFTSFTSGSHTHGGKRGKLTHIRIHSQSHRKVAFSFCKSANQLIYKILEKCMPHNTDDIRVTQLTELLPPHVIITAQPCTEQISDVVYQARQSTHRVLHGMDDRLIVVIGPCSIHDPVAAIDYAKRLKPLQEKYAHDLLIIMRVYFEKPRTTVGWKGLINDPNLDGSFKINEGLQIARKVLCDINALGLPAATEFLDVISPQYIADLIAWGAIGARTTESQIHRELASGLSCPIGFKNGTDGNVKIAVDAIKAASQPHHFLAVTKHGHSAIASTTGNEDCHIILRGGKTPNYDSESVKNVCGALCQSGIASRIMIDASHANSSKKHENQVVVCNNIAEQLASGEDKIIGVMIESNIIAGRQDHVQSITDACIDWSTSEEVLETLAKAVQKRRIAQQLAG
jgi:3-deoxy-7-phosphoheptulonate synthase